ncbi:MAG: hypothetical protein KAY49_01900, partial [Aeromonas sp.]|nr:hypothetical protein [Aeromonas sp.]
QQADISSGMPHGQAEGIIRIFSIRAREGGQIVRNFVWRMDLAGDRSPARYKAVTTILQTD